MKTLTLRKALKELKKRIAKMKPEFLASYKTQDFGKSESSVKLATFESSKIDSSYIMKMNFLN